jgi:redox-sensing transcriptional repressor
MRHIGESTIRRLSVYLRLLDDRHEGAVATVSSAELADFAGTTAAQVRKDLSQFGSFGTRGLGYDVPVLRERLRAILGLEREWRVIIVGAGKIGAALASYPGFAHRGFRVVAVYDANPAKIGEDWGPVVVRPVASLAADVAHLHPDIAVLAVPSSAAQDTLDQLAAVGIRAVLSFATEPLHAPAGVTVKSVNMALELEALSYALAHGA